MLPIGGTVFVRLDGERLLVRGNVTSNIGQTVMRETVTGVDGVHGQTEVAVVPYVECDLTEVPAFPLSRLNAVRNATVTIELLDGRVLTLQGASQVGELTRNSEEGSIAAVRFEGETGTEITAPAASP